MSKKISAKKHRGGKVPPRRPTPRIDGRDMKILQALSLEARASLTQLARRVGTSKQVLSYRLKQLERKKVIRGYHAIPNLAALGLVHYRVFLKYQGMTVEDERVLIDRLKKQKGIAWLTLLEGDFDLEFVVWAKRLEDFSYVYEEILEEFGSSFQEKYFSIATRLEYLSARFLNGEEKASILAIGEQDGKHEPDELDRSILTGLNRDGRMSLAALARTCRVPAAAVKARLKGMLEKRVIIGFGLKMNHNLIGFTYRKVFLKLNDHSQETQRRLWTYLRQQRNVVFILKTIGSFDMEFEVMTASNEEFYNLMRDFRSGFAAEIKLTHSVIVHDELKYGLLSL